MSEINTINLGTEVVIAIRCPCNFSCYYCVSANIHQKTILHSLENIRGYYKDIDTFTVTSMECGTGEPTLHPQIRDILEICTEYGVVSIPTNNSLNPEKWIPGRFTELLYVRAALHPQNESHLESFLNRLLYLKDRGATVVVIFVAHPERMEKIPEYEDYFSKYNIQLDLTSFIGAFQGKKYPESYTQDERAILKLDATNRWWYHRLFPEIVIRDFFGIPCLAGYRSLYVGEDSKLIRCTHDDRPIDTPFKKAVPCMVHRCGCELLLEGCNTSDEVFWNNWYGFAGKELIPQQQKDPEELYQEKKAKYWELMERYGKIERRENKSQVLITEESDVQQLKSQPYSIYNTLNSDLIYDTFHSEEGSLLIKDKIKLFQGIITKLEEIYNIRPFNQQTYQSLTELYLLVKAIQPRTIFELGCGTRSSTIALSIAAAELPFQCQIYGVDISPLNFEKLMKEHFENIKYTPVTDIMTNAINFEIDETWQKPILTLYDAHDFDIPDVKIFPYAKEKWFPKLKNQIVAVHDCSVVDNKPTLISNEHSINCHFSGRYIIGYYEVLGLVDWMNENKINFHRPGDELKKLGFDDTNSSLIYFKVP